MSDGESIEISSCRQRRGVNGRNNDVDDVRSAPPRSWRGMLTACVSFALLVASLPAAAQDWVLATGETLSPAEARISGNGRFYLAYQHDGNLVLYRTGDWPALWASGTGGTSPGRLAMQGDGNLVIYDGSSRAVWHTHTHGNTGSQLIVQDDGNVVLYRSDGTAIWHTHTQIPYGPRANGNDMQPGEILLPGDSILSNDGLYGVLYQADGNLVIYQHGTAKWSSRTGGQPAGVTILQPDGNLVIYAHGMRVVWASGTFGNPGSRLVLEDGGELAIYRPNGTKAWTTVPATPPVPATCNAIEVYCNGLCLFNGLCLGNTVCRDYVEDQCASPPASSGCSRYAINTTCGRSP